MAKKKGPNWDNIIVIVLIVGGGLFLVKDKLPDISELLSFTINVKADVPLDFQEEVDPDYYVNINLNPTTICVGDSTVGSISSNMPNAICSIYWNAGSGTNLYKNVVLDSSGSWSEANTMDSVGAAVFQVACYRGSSYAISNQVTLTVEACPTTTSPVWDPWVCCLVNRDMDCVNSRRCPDGSMPINQYGSEAQCDANCGFGTTTVSVTTTTPVTTTITGPPDGNCNNLCWDAGAPWGGFAVWDPMDCDPDFMAIPGDNGMICCCIMDPPVKCCDCQGDLVCMPEVCEQGCYEVDIFYSPEQCFDNCGVPI